MLAYSLSLLFFSIIWLEFDTWNQLLMRILECRLFPVNTGCFMHQLVLLFSDTKEKWGDAGYEKTNLGNSLQEFWGQKEYQICIYKNISWVMGLVWCKWIHVFNLHNSNVLYDFLNHKIWESSGTLYTLLILDHAILI